MTRVNAIVLTCGVVGLTEIVVEAHDCVLADVVAALHIGFRAGGNHRCDRRSHEISLRVSLIFEQTHGYGSNWSVAGRPAGGRVGGMPESAADVFVVFGISGDLAKEMTFRSLYRLERRRLLDCPIVDVAVDDWTTARLRRHMRWRRPWPL